MSIYRCDKCDEQKNRKWDGCTEVLYDLWCDSCAEILPDDFEDWEITFWMKPIPDRRHDFEAVHVDYDGAIDSLDRRAFTGPNIESLINQINEYNEAE